VVVTYELAERNWRLTVSDNRIGQPEGHFDKTNPGLGTTIIEALAKQQDAMTLAISHREKPDIAVLDAIREVRPPFSPDAVVLEFIVLLRR
jgi:two-component sensor histidine kinase